MESISPEDAAACQAALNSAGTQINGSGGMAEHEGYMEDCQQFIDTRVGDDQTMSTIVYWYLDGEYCSAYYHTFVREYSISGLGDFDGIDSDDGVFHEFAYQRDCFDADAEDAMDYLDIASGLLYP